eukprot:8099476-Pyramimonas_sp.AAC.1
MAHRSSARRSTAQPLARNIKIDPLSFATWHGPWRVLWRVPLASRAARPLTRPIGRPLARFVARPLGTSR